MGETCAGNEWRIRTLGGPGGNPTGDEHWDEISEFVKHGDTEMWEFENPSNVVNPMHVHLVAFQVLDRTELGTGLPLSLGHTKRMLGRTRYAGNRGF